MEKYVIALEKARKFYESDVASPARKKWLESIFPELKNEGAHVLTPTTIHWRACKAGDRSSKAMLIRYPAYLEIGYYAKGDGEWCELSHLERQHEEEKEKVCGTCAYWNKSTLDRGICESGEPHQTHSAETCERWSEFKEMPIKEK